MPRAALLWLALGLLLGVVIGVLVTVAVVARRRPPPPARASGDPGAVDDTRAAFARVHFMKKLVAALRETPRNAFPAPDYRPLLAEGAAPVTCADCHDPAALDLEAMLRGDPGAAAVEPFRRDREGFMVPLMEAWVERLNARHAGRLAQAVTCTDCHAWDPRSSTGRRVVAPLMLRFVRALAEPPRNDNPAPRWRPLLKDPETSSLLCGACHGPRGETWERELAGRDPDPPAPWADDRAFMVALMERWVKRLNRELRPALVKAVVCLDCHETDPRR